MKSQLLEKPGKLILWVFACVCTVCARMHCP
jgi:hypothetical protein